ncbi:MAG: hypothetical protein Q8N44_14730 [Rubrivivax sp.]|nr:hypothetical protein [Rubrivivax sp.]
MTIHIDIGQLIAAVRRHVPLSPMAARAMRNDFVRLLDTTRVTVVTSAPTR